MLFIVSDCMPRIASLLMVREKKTQHFEYHPHACHVHFKELERHFTTQPKFDNHSLKVFVCPRNKSVDDMSLNLKFY